jgi:prolyl 4-hydroxylase
MVNEYPEVLTPEDCQELIDLADPKYQIATTLGDKKDDSDGYRIAENAFIRLDEAHETVKKIVNAISEKTNIPISNMEDLVIVRYQVGGRYKPHHDFFHDGQSYTEDQLSKGGNRKMSTLVYLNDDFEGGETHFTHLGIRIEPERGKLVTWDNMTEEGGLDHTSIHEGMPVISGIKYVAIIFIRERTWTDRNPV